MMIYLVKNKIDGKVYIGKTVRSLKSRRYSHEYDARHDSSMFFHRALRKYGFENFDWLVLEEVDGNLDKREKYWIAFYESTDPSIGYNLSPGGEGGSKKGRVLTIESRKRISSSRKGHSAWNKGIPLTEEHKKNMSLARKGKPISEETRKKFSAAKKGRPLSDFHKERIREGLLRRRTKS